MVGWHENKATWTKKGIPVKEKTVPNYVLKKGAQWWVGLKKRQRKIKKGAQWWIGMQKRECRLKKGAQWWAGTTKRQRRLKKGIPVKEKTVPPYVLKKVAQ